MRQSSNDASESLATVLKSSWENAEVWLTQQKLEITGQTPPPEMSHLDALDNM